MKTRIMTILALLALLVPAVLFAQEQPAERGSVELGARGVWGNVYGRPDLPFTPSLSNSKLNEYQDLKNGFFVRSADANFNDVLGSKNYVTFHMKNGIYKDQSFLASFGRYGKFNFQFRYDETPHVYTDTARTLFSNPIKGLYTFPTMVRTALQTATATTLPGVVNGLIPSFSFITPGQTRKAGGGTASFNLTENWSATIGFTRENEVGTRPIGYVMNSSPSASATAGYGVELPEPIDYFTNTLTAGSEYGRGNNGMQFGYQASIFQNNIEAVTWDNPFNTVDAVGKPAVGRASLYPDNTAQTFSFAGAFDLTKRIRVMASVSPGRVTQNAAFLPYSSSPALQALTSPLPAASANAKRQTLAMNYTFVTHPVKNVEVTARYRSYDLNNDTPVRNFTPTAGDTGLPGAPEANLPYSFFRKNFDLTGTWFFSKKNSVKLAYEWEGFDRDFRDASHTGENGMVAALDLNPRKDLNFRLSYRHASRTPDHYENESEELLPAARRFDENARVRDRVDATLQYSPIDRLTFSATYGTVQDNYNLAANSLTGQAYSYLGGAGTSILPYYSYGLLKDLSYNYDFGVDYAATNKTSFFAEYTREKYNTGMVSRQRNVNTVAGVEVFDNASDSPGNDWTSRDRNTIDTYATGVDFYLSKKVWITTYYSLSAGTGLNNTAALGTAAMYAPGGLFYVPANGAIPAGKFLVTTVMNFPQTTSRMHEAGAILKFKLTKNLEPKFEYRFQQFDNKDYQTNPMDQYMGVANPGASNFYPYINVADSSAARFLFLGGDNPSYRAHVISATLAYHF